MAATTAAATVAVNVYFVRHGLSYGNDCTSQYALVADKELRDPLLTLEGIKASFENGRRFRRRYLGGASFDYLFCSPLLRTAETAFYFDGLTSTRRIAVAPYVSEVGHLSSNVALDDAKQMERLATRGYDIRRLRRARWPTTTDKPTLAAFLGWLGQALPFGDHRDRDVNVAVFTHSNVIRKHFMRRGHRHTLHNNGVAHVRVVFNASDGSVASSHGRLRVLSYGAVKAKRRRGTDALAPTTYRRNPRTGRLSVVERSPRQTSFARALGQLRVLHESMRAREERRPL
jgi:broad specificity phosphatase PhoE